jgi:hypothetical protein
MYVAYLYTQCTFREMIKRKKLLLVVPQTRPESTDDFVIRLGTHVTKRSGLVFLKAPNFLPDEIAQIRKVTTGRREILRQRLTFLGLRFRVGRVDKSAPVERPYDCWRFSRRLNNAWGVRDASTAPIKTPPANDMEILTAI